MSVAVVGVCMTIQPISKVVHMHRCLGVIIPPCVADACFPCMRV